MNQSVRWIIVFLCLFSAASESVAVPPSSLDEAIAILSDGPPISQLPIRVVDQSGDPVADALVTPWALRSGQGHGLWVKVDDSSQIKPVAVRTDPDGRATIAFPKYRNLAEQIATIGVSLNTVAKGFVSDSDHHIEVPASDTVEIVLRASGAAELTPQVNGEAIPLEQIYAVARYQSTISRGSQSLRVDGLPPGSNAMMLVAVQGNRATHFSEPVAVTVEPGKTTQRMAMLRPAIRITGQLDHSVPRPVAGGRVIVQTIPPPRSETAEWALWTDVKPDGTFVIDGWPAGRPFQAIALTDRHIGKPGSLPPRFRRNLLDDSSRAGRPQVFEPNDSGAFEDSIVIAMEPLIPVTIRTHDLNDQPLSDVGIYSFPNVFWWNWGSQIYALWLPKSIQWLRDNNATNKRESLDEWRKSFPAQFLTRTDSDGHGQIWLPPSEEVIDVVDDRYELPVFLGKRHMKIDVTDGVPIDVTLSLQPAGTDRLGEWDKLAGVVFGCSTRQGQQICALPGVREKMNEFARRFREAGGQRDPKLMAEAYRTVADAFDSAADPAEAAKWRVKAEEQEALAASQP